MIATDDLRWMADWGFDFVRFPMAYPRFCICDQSRPITFWGLFARRYRGIASDRISFDLVNEPCRT